MGSITWGTYKPRSSGANIKKLSLDKDEQARVCFLEPTPQAVYVHNFEKVVTGPDGKPIQEKDTWADGSERISTKTEYAGKLRCLGNEDELERSGADPENCPACRAHIENPNAVKKAALRVLGHVLKYSTRPNSFNPTKPFSASLLVWDLTEKRFGQLNDIFEEHGNLSEKDLLLGPCENKQMQKYTIAVGSGDALWTQSDATRTYVTELLNEERVEDLSGVAGKLPSAFEMEAKVKEVVRAYNHAFGLGTGGAGSYESIIGSSNVSAIAEEADEDDEEEVAVAPRVKAKAKPKSAPVVEEPEDSDDDADDDADDDDEETDVTASLEDILKGFAS